MAAAGGHANTAGPGGKPELDNPYEGDPQSRIDIDVTYISRSPRYDYDAAKNTPQAGDLVTFTAHIRSRGTASTGRWDYVWSVDGVPVNSGAAPSMAPDSELTLSLDYTWEEGDHWISFFADPDNLTVELSEQNNLRTDRINALLVGLWVEQSIYDYFDQHQYAYCREFDIPDEANSWEDWAQRQMAKWNEILADAVYPSTPQGCLDRVRLDRVVVVPDGALPLHGGLPTNHPDTWDKTVDMMWGIPAGHLDGSFYSPDDPNSAFNLEPSLIHEMNHARYLVDNYGLDVGGNQIAVRDENGERLFPDNHNLVLPNSQGATMMGGGHFRYGEWEAAGLNVYAGMRPLPGWANFNAHAGLGKYLANAMPRHNYLRIVDSDGHPAAGAAVEIYQAGDWPGEWHWYAKYIDDTVDMAGTTDAEGLFNMGPNPFSQAEPIGGSNFFKCVNFIKIKHRDEILYTHLDIAQVNVEFWRGHIENAYYEIRLPNCNEDVPDDQWQAEFWTYDGGVPDQPEDPDSLPATWGRRHIKENAGAQYGQGETLDLDFDLYGGSPNRCDVGQDRFIVLFRKTVDFQRGPYTFTAGSDDGIKVWIKDIEDGVWKELETLRYWDLRGFSTQTGSHTFTTAGPREVAVAFFENWGGARVKLDWSFAGSSNAPPQVHAGPDQAVTLPHTVSLGGSVQDDGLPDPPGQVTIAWSKASGPGSVIFHNPSSASTTASFGAAGTYVLRLTANDGALSAFDEAVVVANPQPNTPPSVPSVDGPTDAEVGATVTFTAVSTDPEGHRIGYTFDWGDGQSSTTDLLAAGTRGSLSHTYQAAGDYGVKVRAVDEQGASSDWSELTEVEIQAAVGEELVISDSPTGTWYLGSSPARRSQAQIFKAIGAQIHGASLALTRVGSPAAPIVVTIRRSLTGSPLASAQVDPSRVTSVDPHDPARVTVSFPEPVEVHEGFGYFLVLEVNRHDAQHHYRVGYDKDNPYPYGMWYLGTTPREDLDMACTVLFGN